MRGKVLQKECECEQRLGGRRASRVTPRGQRREEEGGRVLTERLKRKVGA